MIDRFRTLKQRIIQLMMNDCDSDDLTWSGERQLLQGTKLRGHPKEKIEDFFAAIKVLLLQSGAPFRKNRTLFIWPR